MNAQGLDIRPTDLRLFHHLFEKQTERAPEGVALAAAHRRMTYLELNRAANRLAHALIDWGVGPETLVGLCVDRSFEMVVSLLAIWKAGGAYVPLDPEYPNERLKYILDDSAVKLLLTTERLKERLPRQGAQQLLIEDLQSQHRSSFENPDVPVGRENLAYLIYTSGSTGRPKGVMIEHRGLVNLSDEQVRVFKMHPDDRILQLSSLCFDASVFEIAMALRVGATLCLMPEQTRFLGGMLLELLQYHRITCLTIVPSVLRHLPEQHLPDLATIIAAGEACSAELVDQWAVRGRRFFNAYGPTETTVWATVEECQRGGGKPLIGRPIHHTYARVLDAERKPVPAGTPGELYLGGVHLARGYHNARDLTEERFVADPLAQPPGGRLYRTGDRAAVLGDGRIDFLGRTDDQIKLRGFRIDPSEIEQLLISHVAIEQCVVRAWEDRGRKTLAAYLVCREGQATEGAALRAFLEQRLPAHMVPADYVFLPVMPLGPTGKVDREALPPPLHAHPKDSVHGPQRGPDDDLETRLAALFGDILGHETVDVNARLFDDLGGDSLASVDLVVGIENEFGVRLPIRVLFDHDTVKLLAEVLRGDGARPGAGAGGRAPTNWAGETELEPELASAVRAVSKGPQVLLTGATGFLGSFLLKELLDESASRIFCLTRADGDAAAMARIRDSLSRYGLWRDAYAGRIEPVAGEIACPRLGLTAHRYESLAGVIDVIFHCAALVNFVYPYGRLKPANVEGTRNLIRFASQRRPKLLNHVSSLAVYGSVGYFGYEHIDEDELENIDTLYMGYAESKAVSERLVRAAGDHGLPVKIYRLDDVIGHSQTGVWNTDDFICRYLKGAIQLGMVPDLDIRINAVPVDVVARILRYLSLSGNSSQRCFNVFNPQGVRQEQLFDHLRQKGYQLQRVPYRQWQQILLDEVRHRKDNALYPLVSLFLEAFSEQGLTIPEMYEEKRRPRFSDANTRAALAKSGVVIPALDARLLDTYHRYFVDSGFLAPPQHAGMAETGVTAGG